MSGTIISLISQAGPDAFARVIILTRAGTEPENASRRERTLRKVAMAPQSTPLP